MLTAKKQRHTVQSFILSQKFSFSLTSENMRVSTDRKKEKEKAQSGPELNASDDA